jgi:hypothetical protein
MPNSATEGHVILSDLEHVVHEMFLLFDNSRCRGVPQKGWGI